MNPGLPDAQAVFTEVYQLEGAELARVLERLCGRNQALRQEVESLLSAHDQAGTFLGEPTPAPLRDGSLKLDGTKIDCHRLLGRSNGASQK